MGKVNTSTPSQVHVHTWWCGAFSEVFSPLIDDLVVRGIGVKVSIEFRSNADVDNQAGVGMQPGSSGSMDGGEGGIKGRGHQAKGVKLSLQKISIGTLCVFERRQSECLLRRLEACVRACMREWTCKFLESMQEESRKKGSEGTAQVRNKGEVSPSEGCRWLERCVASLK